MSKVKSDSKIFDFLGKYLVYKPTELDKDPIDFTKSWFQLFWLRKTALFLMLSLDILGWAYIYLTPFVISYWLGKQDILSIILWLVARLVIYFVAVITDFYNSNAFNSLVENLNRQVVKFFLEVDPIFHTTKSTGTAYSKLKRATGNLESFISSFTGSLLPVIIGFTTVLGSFLIYDFSYFMIILVGLLIICGFNIWQVWFRRIYIRPFMIEREDKQNAVELEMLSQMHFVRSTFATNEKFLQHKTLSQKSRSAKFIGVLFGRILYSSVIVSYYLMLGVVGYMLFLDLNSGKSTLPIVTGLFVGMMYGTGQIFGFGSLVLQLMDSSSNIEELFEYIRDFGKSSFPVLGE